MQFSTFAAIADVVLGNRSKRAATPAEIQSLNRRTYCPTRGLSYGKAIHYPEMNMVLAANKNAITTMVLEGCGLRMSASGKYCES